MSGAHAQFHHPNVHEHQTLPVGEARHYDNDNSETSAATSQRSSKNTAGPAVSRISSPHTTQQPLTHRHCAEVGRHGDAPGRLLLVKVALLICECGVILVAEALRSNEHDAFVLYDET